MVAAPLLTRARMIRDLLELAQKQAGSLSADIQQAAQLARVNKGSADANTLETAAGETTEVVRALAAAVGCIDDGMVSLETVALSEAHPGASEEEFEAILRGRTSG